MRELLLRGHGGVDGTSPYRTVSASLPLDEWKARRAHGIELAKLGQYERAKQVFLSIGDFLNICHVLCQQERYEEALEAAETAIQTEPVKACVQMAAIHYNLGNAEGMERAINRGLSYDLSFPKLYEARGVLKLGRGDILGGFKDWKTRTWPRIGKDLTRASMPEWDGHSRLDGKTCWVLQEQGHGDQILWARSLIGFCERTGCAQLVVVPTPGLERLLQHALPEARVVNAATPDLPVADTWASIATVQINSPDSVPWHGPYLKALPEDIDRLALLTPKTGRLRVGLCWAGSPGYYIDRDRSLPFTAYAPILKVEGCDFYSIQFGFSSNENNLIPDLSLQCRDFADTAAMIANLDLVITVDTSVANLCGAMGHPCWVLLRPPIDFRWGWPDERHDWFGPNIRQFRDTIPAVVADALREFVTDDQRAAPAPLREVPPPITRVDTRYGAMDIFTNGMWLNRSLKLYGEWSEFEMDVMRAMCPYKGVVVEAGANIGAHTLGLAQWADEVWAFEPHPETFRLLQANLFRNPSKAIVHAYNAAIGESEGTGRMDPFNLSIPFNPGGAELQDDPAGDIEITTIDSLGLDRLDLLKADVEGCELAVIRGALETIKRCRPVLYLEDNRGEFQNDIYALLDSLDYRLHKHKVLIWNPNNWRGMKVNAFGGHYSEMLLAVPKERGDLLANRYCQGRPV